MAAAASGLKLVFFVIGMVSQPAAMTLATEEPEIVPNRLKEDGRHLAKGAACAAGDRVREVHEELPAPDFS